MAHWLLQGNPAKWRVFDFFADGHELTSWTVSRYLDRVANGDDVALWLTGRTGGVVALGTVTGQPAQISDDGDDDEYWVEPADGDVMRWSLPITLTHVFLHDPVTRGQLTADPRFAGAAVLRQPWAGNPFPLTGGQWAAVVDHVNGRAAAQGRYVPAEATTGAEDLLRRLIGEPLSTVTGRRNTILSVRPPDVLVATDRSPAGRPVPIASVDDALDRLVNDGHVLIDPAAIGYRSAFIGAVLLTLPGACFTGRPPMITLQSPDLADAETGGFTFEGDLDRGVRTVGRGEQVQLRWRLFGSATEASCALCGDTYPVRFLWAAHIKKRAACTDEERRDLDHIAMPACLFGCDALFETGYLGVDADGRILTSDPGAHPSLADRLAQLRGRTVAIHAGATAQYFAWHRDNTFRG